MLPTMSVITPSYNCADYIGDALLSVSRQQEVAAEHIVVDAVSSDDTREIVQQHGGARWVSEPDRGQSDAINKGFRMATGELMGWLNADDYYLPGGLEAIARAAKEHPEADVIYGDCVFVDRNGRVVRSKVEHRFDRFVLMYFGCYIPSTATFFRRRVLDAGFLLDCDYRVCMDFEYFARLAHSGFRFHYVPRIIAAFRWHATNVSLRNADRRLEERRKVQRNFGCNALSEVQLEHRCALARAKRLFLKASSGNVDRELRLRQLMGRDTQWLQTRAGWETCRRLAYL